jgi:hypothetical protein
LIRGRLQHASAGASASPRSRVCWWIAALGGALIVTAATILAVNVAPAPGPVHPSATAPTSPGGGLGADFAQLQTGLHATVGLVLRAAGAGSKSQVVLGSSDFADRPAWSTIKVPLVIAAMRQLGIDRTTPRRRLRGSGALD